MKPTQITNDQLLAITKHEDGVYRCIANNAGTIAKTIEGRYWRIPVGGEPGPSMDLWRYQLPTGEIYSHPTEHGCQIMLKKFFVEKGIIPVPTDNSHLDEKDTEILAEIQDAWEQRGVLQGTPRTGDFILLPDGSYRRVCATYDHSAQTTTALLSSYSTGRGGWVSYSGGLDSSVLHERLIERTDMIKLGRFWFFHHGRAGAGRGVNCYMPCKVFDWVPEFTMTEEEAKAHPIAVRSREFWGETHQDYLKTVASLMRGGHEIT